MTENEQKYTDYVKDLSKVRVTMLSLLAGFTFSTITILLNQLPDPQSFPSQGTLLFLTVMFNLLLFLLMWQMVIVVGLYDVRRPPPRSVWELTTFNIILTSVFVMWGYSLPLIFLLWSLPSLALVSGITWTAFVVIYGHASRSMMRRLGWSVVEEVKKAKKTRVARLRSVCVGVWGVCALKFNPTNQLLIANARRVIVRNAHYFLL